MILHTGQYILQQNFEIRDGLTIANPDRRADVRLEALSLARLKCNCRNVYNPIALVVDGTKRMEI